METEANIDVLGYELGAGIHLAKLDDVKKVVSEVNKYRYVAWNQNANIKTDVNGNASFAIGDVLPVGKRLRIYRILIWADGYTPGAAYVNAATWVGIFDAPGQGIESLIDVSPETDGAQVFPSIATYNKHNAPMTVGGKQLFVGVFSGPPSTNVSVFMRGELTAL